VRIVKVDIILSMLMKYIMEDIELYLSLDGVRLL